MASSLAQTSTTDAIHVGAELVSNRIRRDEKYPKLWDLVYSQSASGEYEPPKPFTQFYRDHAVELPDTIRDRFNHVQVKSYSGLFPAINRAWVTIDNVLYLWNYVDGSDVQSYEGLDQVIITAAIVSPKKDVFVDEVENLLVLATSVEIVLLALLFDEHEQRITIHETKYALPTDDVKMERVVGTQNGRIFMCGRDGCIYEVDYAPETNSWWTTLGLSDRSRKVRKLNHTSHPLSSYVPSFLRWSSDQVLTDACVDNSRNIFYTLSTKSVIQVFDLGNGNDMKFVTASADIIREARSKYPGLQKFDTKILELISIAPITSSESEQINLVAVARCGIRMYFSTNRVNRYSLYTYSKSRPRGLFLQHIRVPPSRHSPSIKAAGQTGALGGVESGLANSNIHTAFYSNGVFIFADELTATRDTVVAVSPNVSHNLTIGGQSSTFEVSVSTPFREVYDTIPLGDGRTWEIHEMPLEMTGPEARLLAKSMINNELAYQHLSIRRQFLCLTSDGIHFLKKSRPVDDLRRLLQEKGHDSQEVLQFRDLYGIDEFCAMCLVLAATDAEVAPTSPLRGNVVSDPIQMQATNAFFSLGGQPHREVSDTDGNAADNTTPTIVHSGCHDGFATYLGRILYPMWTQNIVQGKEVTAIVQGKQVKVTRYLATFTREDYQRTEARLRNLEAFLTRNQFAPIAEGSASLYSAGTSSTFTISKSAANFQRRRVHDESYTVESNSLSNLHLLLRHCIESLSFLSILQNHNLSQIIAALPSIGQSKFAGMRFNNFCASQDGVEFSKELVNALISLHKGEGEVVLVESIGQELRNSCPSLFSEDDSLRFKGFEALNRSKTAKYREEQLSLLADSVRYFTRIPQHLVHQNILELICGEYHYLRYYEGVVELCLACAHSVDSSGIALKWIQDGMPKSASDSVHELFAVRRACYKPILTSLMELSLADSTKVATPLVDPRSGEMMPRPRFSPEDERIVKNSIVNMCKKSTDELFHYTLYQWWLDEGLEKELLSVESPFLEKFLKDLCKPEVKAFELLWQYYAKHENFAAATIVLTNLAERQDSDVDLRDRLSYLSRAVMNGKAALAKTRSFIEPTIRGEELQELEEKLEVAKVQTEVLKEVGNIVKPSIREESQKLLNSRLFTLSELYNQFATKLGLTVSALHIFQSSGHSDMPTIERIWASIFEDSLEVPGRDGLLALKAKVESIGQDFFPNDQIFPLRLLIEKLEAVRIDFEFLRAEAGAGGMGEFWVIELFQRVGVPLEVLFREYSHLVSSPDPYWRDHQLDVFHIFFGLVDLWFSALVQGDPSAHDIRTFRLSEVSTIIEEILTRLEGIRGANVEALTHDYRTLLERILSSKIISSSYTEYQ